MGLFSIFSHAPRRLVTASNIFIYFFISPPLPPSFAPITCWALFSLYQRILVAALYRSLVIMVYGELRRKKIKEVGRGGEGGTVCKVLWILLG